MAEYIKEISLDFNAEYQEYNIKTVFAKQLDENSRFLLIEPQLDGEKFDVRDCTVKLYAERPDKQVIVVDGEITDEGNIYVELISEVISITGIVRCDIKLLENEKQLSSCLFHLNVIKSIGLNAPEPIGITDHEVVTIDLYQINENEIIPENTNAVVNLAPTELQPTAANTAVNLAPTELQPVSVKIETISANFEEDTEL